MPHPAIIIIIIIIIIIFFFHTLSLCGTSYLPLLYTSSSSLYGFKRNVNQYLTV